MRRMGYGGKYIERAKGARLRAQAWTCRRSPPSSASPRARCRSGCETSSSRRNRGTVASGGPQTAPDADPQGSRDRAAVAVDAATSSARSERERLMYALASTPVREPRATARSVFANSDPGLIRVFLAWFRRQFDSTNPSFACGCTCTLTSISMAQLSVLERVDGKSCRGVPEAVSGGRRQHAASNRHVYGCVGVAVPQQAPAAACVGNDRGDQSRRIAPVACGP